MQWPVLSKDIFLKMGRFRPLFYFRPFLITISIQIEKSVDGVLGIRTRGRRMAIRTHSPIIQYCKAMT